MKMFFIYLLKYNLILLLIISANLYPTTIAVLPFTSKDNNWITNYLVDDGIPRTIVDSLINTRKVKVIDYDIFASYFASYETVIDYKTIATNTEIATNFIKKIFNVDYLINGEVLDFTLITNGQKENKATVEIKANLIDINNLKTIYSFTHKATVNENKKKQQSKVYTAEDSLFYESILGKATMKASDNIASDIISNLNINSTTGIITRIDNNKIYINLGKRNGVKVDDLFEVYKVENYINTNKFLENKKNYDKLYEFSNIEKKVNNNQKYTNVLYTNSFYGYQNIRSNDNDEVWYTSEKLFKYTLMDYRETFITTLKVIELYNTYAILEEYNNNKNNKLELTMKVVLKK